MRTPERHVSHQDFAEIFQRSPQSHLRFGTHQERTLGYARDNG